MSRARAIALAVIVALLLVALAALRWAARPETVGPLLLGMAGDALGLEIAADAFEYRLRGTPEIVARGIEAREPGAPRPLLTADRILLSVPWRTLRARGATLDVRRLELDAPALDLPAFRRWWAARPPGDGRVPAFADGIRIVDGRIAADGWRLDGLDADLPRFAAGAPLRAHVRGRYAAAALRAPFDLRVAMTRAAPDAGLGIAGTVAPAAEDWRAPVRLRLSGRLRSEDGIALRAARLSLHGSLDVGGDRHRLVAGAAGDALAAVGGVRVDPLAVVLRGDGMLPRLRAGGRVALRETLALTLEGALADWPQAWPALPAPLDRGGPLPFALGYEGVPDLSAPLAVRLARGGAGFEGRVRAHDVGGWLDGLDRGTPLPPLEGVAHATELRLPGATLHGVEVRIGDDGAPGTP